MRQAANDNVAVHAATTTTKRGYHIRTVRKLTEYIGSTRGRYVDIALPALPLEVAA